MKLYSAQFVFPYEVYKKEKLEFAKGGETDDVIMIKIGGDKKYPYYIKKIDTTHISMANNKDGVDLVIPSHILQHRGESYYDDVRSWLKGGTSPNGKSYDSDYYAKGGKTQKEYEFSYRIYDEKGEEIDNGTHKMMGSDRESAYDKAVTSIEEGLNDGEEVEVSKLNYQDRYKKGFAKGGMITEESNYDIIANVKKEQGKSDFYYALYDKLVAYGERPKIAFSEMKEVFANYDENMSDYIDLPFAKGGEVEKNEEHNTMLIGGIAGILLGIFLGRK